MNKGKIHQIIGPVIDIKFNEDEMPELLNAVNIEFQGRTIVTEVAQHKGDDSGDGTRSLLFGHNVSFLDGVSISPS